MLTIYDLNFEIYTEWVNY